MLRRPGYCGLEGTHGTSVWQMESIDDEDGADREAVLACDAYLRLPAYASERYPLDIYWKGGTLRATYGIPFLLIHDVRRVVDLDDRIPRVVHVRELFRGSLRFCDPVDVAW